MIGEISIGGVYIPALLVMVVGAAILTLALSRVLAVTGAYRYVATRPIVDIALFVLFLGLLVLLTAPPELYG
jgi:hypothetical protein